MANYFLTNKAVEDLSEIWNYTYETWSESQADKYYELLIGFCKKISENPKIGKITKRLTKIFLGIEQVNILSFIE